MFPEEVPLTPEAEARLIALDEHQELGAGMQIALRDLEIRGAGSMLGAEQSGNLSSVGFDLFAQMLNEAVACAREGASVDENGLPPALSDITINIGGSAFLSEDFIPDTDARVLAYRQLACAASLEAVEEIAHALAAAHGELPPEAAQLISRSRLKVLCAEHGVASITNAAGYVHFEPVDLHAPKQAELRRQGARYVKDKRKLSVPARSLVAADAQVSYASVFEFLQDIYNVSSQDDSRAAAHTVASCASYSSRKAAKSAPKAASKGGEGVTGAPKRAAKPSARGQVTHSPTPAPAKSASAQPNAARSLSAARTEQKAQAKAARQAARAEAAGARAASAHTRAGLHTGKSANVHDATVGSVRTTKTNPRKRKRSL
jgi:transcription-repair coupling factor (superfamily II helicase)